MSNQPFTSSLSGLFIGQILSFIYDNFELFKDFFPEGFSLKNILSNNELSITRMMIDIVKNIPPESRSKELEILINSNKTLKEKAKTDPDFFKEAYIYIARAKRVQSIIKDNERSTFQVADIGCGLVSSAADMVIKNPYSTHFMLDLPEVIDLRQSAMRKLGATKNLYSSRNLEFIPIDLNVDNLQAKLEEKGFDKTKRTIFIMQGVAPYIKKEKLIEIIKFIGNKSAAGSILMATIVKEDDDIYENVMSRSEFTNMLTANNIKIDSAISYQDLMRDFYKNMNIKVAPNSPIDGYLFIGSCKEKKKDFAAPKLPVGQGVLPYGGGYTRR